MIPVRFTQLVYFPLNNSAGAVTKFPNVNNLIGEDVEVIGISAFTSDQLAATPDLATTVSAADALSCVVNIAEGSDQLMIETPYTDFVRPLNAGIWTEMEPFAINLQNCSVKTTGAITASNAAFNIYYRLKSAR